MKCKECGREIHPNRCSYRITKGPGEEPIVELIPFERWAKAYSEIAIEHPLAREFVDNIQRNSRSYQRSVDAGKCEEMAKEYDRLNQYHNTGLMKQAAAAIREGK